MAVLNEDMAEEKVMKDSVIYVNWLKRSSLFDFDRIEIVKASDYEVEKFWINVGNDTDDFRKKRYKNMPCVIDSHCQLTQNTINMLRGTFKALSWDDIKH